MELRFFHTIIFRICLLNPENFMALSYFLPCQIVADTCAPSYIFLFLQFFLLLEMKLLYILPVKSISFKFFYSSIINVDNCSFGIIFKSKDSVDKINFCLNFGIDENPISVQSNTFSKHWHPKSHSFPLIHGFILSPSLSKCGRHVSTIIHFGFIFTFLFFSFKQ